MMERMRLFALLLALAMPVRAEFDLENVFAQASDAAKARAAAAKEKKRRVFPLETAPARPAEFSAPLALDAPLSELRDGPLEAVRVTIDGKDWLVGVTADAGFDDFYLVLTAGGERLIAPLAPIGRFLEDGGVVVSDDEGPALRLSARISLLHPITGTTVIAVDPAGGKASKDSFSVGELVDALKAKGRGFKAGDQDIHAFVLSEAEEGGAALSAERSIVFVKFAWTKTKAFSVRESALQPGTPVRVNAFGRILILNKTVDGRLVVRDAGSAPKR